MKELSMLAQAMHAQKIAVLAAFEVVTATQQCSREMLRTTLENYPHLAPAERRHCLIFNDLCLEITAQCREMTEQGLLGAMRLFSPDSCRKEATGQPSAGREQAPRPAGAVSPKPVAEPAAPTPQQAALAVAAPLLTATLEKSPAPARKDPARAETPAKPAARKRASTRRPAPSVKTRRTNPGTAGAEQTAAAKAAAPAKGGEGAQTASSSSGIDNASEGR